MATVKITLTRPDTSVHWGPEWSEEEMEQELLRIAHYREDPAIESLKQSDDGLTFTVIRTGTPEACQAFYNDLVDPNSAFKKRITYYTEANITHRYELSE